MPKKSSKEDSNEEKKTSKKKSGIERLVPALAKTVKQSAAGIGRLEARFLVDSYHTMQAQRVRLAEQLRSAERGVDDQPCEVLRWFHENAEALEKAIGGALKTFAESQPIGRWAMSICGVGPVFSAGLIAHIDMEKAPTPGHIISFAGLHPLAKWEKGCKRPWNADLKKMCWLLGESFIKVQNNPNDIYGKLYAQRKIEEEERNEKGLYAEQAAEKLRVCKKMKKDTQSYKIYETGKLPPSHIVSRARRYATKIFLSHWWEQAFKFHYGRNPDFVPYPIAHMGHMHKIEVPNQDFEEGAVA